MKHRRHWFVGIAALALAGAVWAAAGAGASPAQQAKAAKTKVTLQLKWVTQAQFAGYYAAKAKGYYGQAGLDVKIKVGGPDIIPEQVVAGGQAEFGLDWLPSLLSARDKGTKLVNIGQVFTRSGMTQLTWKDSGINTIAKMRGKKVGNWLGGNEFELFAALTRAGMDPSKNKGVTMEKWIGDKSHQATAKKFLAASFKGWIWCRDHASDCVNIVLKQGPTLLRGHQAWQMNEINALIWPAPKGIGIMDRAAFDRTAKI